MLGLFAMIVGPRACLQAVGNHCEPAALLLRNDCEPNQARVCKPASYHLCEFYHLMRLDKQTCDWHDKKCDSLCVTQDISKETCQAASNAVALIRVKINPDATNNVASRILKYE